MDKDDKRISESSALGRLMKSISDSYSSISNQLLLPLGLTWNSCKMLQGVTDCTQECCEKEKKNG